MAAIIANSSAATPRERLADVRGHQAKADLREQVGATRLREIAAEALRRVTSQKAAATDIGIHEGRLSHKLKDGSLTLAQLESFEHEPKFYAELGRLLTEAYGPLDDPKVRAQRACDEVQALVNELRQYIEVA